MKITKATYLGKIVIITWRDPLGALREMLEDAPKGNAALGEWVEYGYVDDITDGVIRVIHSKGKTPGPRETYEIGYTVIPEELIIAIVILEPIVTPGSANVVG